MSDRTPFYTRHLNLMGDVPPAEETTPSSLPHSNIEERCCYFGNQRQSNLCGYLICTHLSRRCDDRGRTSTTTPTPGTQFNIMCLSPNWMECHRPRLHHRTICVTDGSIGSAQPALALSFSYDTVVAVIWVCGRGRAAQPWLAFLCPYLRADSECGSNHSGL